MDILRKIREFAQSREFNRLAQAAARKMVTHLFDDTGRTWRQAALTNSKGRMIYEAMRKALQGPLGSVIHQQVERNAEIIKTLPTDISKRVTQHIYRESMKGVRASEITKQIMTFFPDATKAKANLIARTETSKTSTALTQARSESVGIGWYRWRTSEDQRVRESHKLMDNVLVRWDDPPSPEKLDGIRSALGKYPAGGAPNCRCYPEPVISLDLISWPARVYRNGSITKMSRKQFEKIM